MPVKLKIKVTKDILKRSANCNSESFKIFTNCAIALAIRDIFSSARVYSTLLFFGSDNRGVADLPNQAVQFIHVFDDSTPQQRIDMEELEFEINVPDEVIETIDISDIHKCPTLELV